MISSLVPAGDFRLWTGSRSPSRRGSPDAVSCVACVSVRFVLLIDLLGLCLEVSVLGAVAYDCTLASLCKSPVVIVGHSPPVQCSLVAISPLPTESFSDGL